MRLESRPISVGIDPYEMLSYVESKKRRLEKVSNGNEEKGEKRIMHSAPKPHLNVIVAQVQHID